MQGILLALGFVAFVVAIFTPVTKTASFVAGASFIGYFYLNGIQTWLPLLLFVFGLLLIVFEILVPDFGVAGILGTLALIVGVHWSSSDVMQTLRDISIAIVITAGVVIYLIRKGYSLRHLNRFVLKTDSKAETITKKETSDFTLFPGQEGTVRTPLRPTGKASFEKDSPLYDVLSTEGMLAIGTPIVIEKIEGSKILVREKR
ncbi:MAG TPA: hydrolase [Candidatus Tetragenococcus pullicola]|nr:hydrolase [Candidatus Tetragenococcus pullicola]